MQANTATTVDPSEESVWTAAAAAVPGATLRVEYDSTRSDEDQTVEGRVERVSGRHEGAIGVMSIIFRRDDGQYMAVESNGALLSIGSHYPRTGTVIEASIVAECPDCGEETYLNENGEAVYCGLCSEEYLTDGYRADAFKATAGVGDH